MEAAEFHYRITWRVDSPRPGFHPSRQHGAGFDRRGNQPFIASPDPRRIDLRASVCDPWERLQVKVFNQTSAVPVYALLDLSASMAFAGIADKRATLSDFVTALGYSAYRTGDAFGYVGFDHAPCPQFVVSPRTAPGVGVELAARLRTYAFPGRSAQGIVAATRLLGMQPALVFVVSDFYFPLRLWASALAAMTRHRVVPLVLHDRAESLQLPKLWPRLRLARIVDPETGAARTLLLRRSLCRRIQAHRARHRERLSALCHAHDCAPLFVEGEFSPASVTRYFNG